MLACLLARRDGAASAEPLLDGVKTVTARRPRLDVLHLRSSGRAYLSMRNAPCKYTAMSLFSVITLTPRQRVLALPPAALQRLLASGSCSCLLQRACPAFAVWAEELE